MVVGGIFDRPFPIISTVVLAPLPGSPKFLGDFDAVIERAVREAEELQELGVDGLIVENLGDAPYFKDRAPPETVACMARVLCELRRRVSIPFGVNVLRNCARESLGLAYAFGGRFIRVNVLTEAYVTDQGIIEGVAAELMRVRRLIGGEHVKVFADVHVKHASPLLRRDIRESALDLVERGLADAVIVTGPRTGEPPSVDDLKSVRGVAPVLIGSGLNLENVERLLPLADGAIVGTYFRVGGRLGDRIDHERVRLFMERVRRVRGRLVEG